MAFMVPEFNEDKLASSSMILADHLEKVATKNVGSGSFVIGETKLAYPHLDAPDGKPASFKRDQRMNLWMQVYNLQADEKTKKPSAKIEYEIVNMANNQAGAALLGVHRHNGQRGRPDHAGEELGAEQLSAGRLQADGESGRQRFQAADRAFGTVCC